MKPRTASASHRHCASRAVETGTRLVSLRLSHTMNDVGARGPVRTVYTGIMHSRSQPGQIALAAGRAFASNPCDFMATTAAAGHWPISSALTNTVAPLSAATRANNSVRTACGVIGPATSEQIRAGKHIGVAEFRQLAVSHRRMVRVDRHDAGLKGLQDVETGETFYTDAHRLVSK